MNRLENFMMAQSEKLNEFILSCNKMFEVLFTHGKMLENQINELAIPLRDCASPLSLPSQEVDFREPMCAMTTRSVKVLKESVPKKSKESEKESDSSEGNKHEEPSKMSEDSMISLRRKSGSKMRYKLDEQFGKFVEMLKQLHLTLPFTDVVEQMPNYAKFLKEILSGKRACNMVEPVNLGECFSAFIHNDLPQKLKDPGNFSVPCKIKGKLFHNALCDLCASVSIMPYSVFKKLKLGELLPSNMTLQLANRSIKFPKGRVEDVPLKIGEFTIPIDFIVLEIAEDDHIPFILRRPFLTTSGTLIDVKGGRITLRVGKNEEGFELKPTHESLSLVKGIICVNSPRPIDNVCMIDFSTNNVIENCDDVLLSCDCKKVSEEKT
ncbi:uncharacterized protein LOC110699225 [Chenopodium quinoa]|uniref:uncharacterized protein LOC110699225 n=1 Tax=Chenopodium quinoa TaxID=63459 RepID=UPI000B7972E6|nr:uncharacterized protein LOC110699225 [Chenopodium quinoa]